MFLCLLCVVLPLSPVSADVGVQMTPDGNSYVGGDPQMAPDGSYVGGTPEMTPDGASYVGGTPQMAPDGSYVGGTPEMAPDGEWMGVNPQKEDPPDGHEDN